MTGDYDLVSVLTCKGRSADSGHYVAWVKQECGWFSSVNRFITIQLDLNLKRITLVFFFVSEKWIEYDDDNPIPQREEDITKLSGGGKITRFHFLNCAITSVDIVFALSRDRACISIFSLGLVFQVIGIWHIFACTRPELYPSD